MGKKEDPKKEPAPATYITITKVENGWTVEDLHNCRTVIAACWADVVKAATAMAGFNVYVRLTLPVDMGE